MSRALNLARKGRYTADPNPCVGCVLVSEGKVIGEGWHWRAGEAHAEVNALAMAGDSARGSSMYVTLEPCSHTGRTGPCADAVIEAGISELVVAMQDPNPQVAGQGLEKIRAAGIAVRTGVLEQDARALNPAYVCRMENNRPLVRIKMATSLDGRTAMESGESQWVTGVEARRDVQKLRALSSAVISSAVTVIQDDARLDVRPGAWKESYSEYDFVRQPARVILDSQARLTGNEKLFSCAGQVIIFTAKGMAGSFSSISEKPEVQVIEAGKSVDGLDLQEVCSILAAMGFNSLLVEAGPTLAGQWVEQDLFDEVILYMAPVLLGSRGKPAFVLENISTMDEKLSLELLQQRYVGNDIKMVFARK